MITRKKVSILAVATCVIIASLSVVAYGGSTWSPQSVAIWMQYYGVDYIRDTYNAVYNRIEPTLDNFIDWVKDEVDQETVEIEILPIEHTTFLEFYPPTPSVYQSTTIGESDIYSGVYVMPTISGFKCNAAYMTATVKDGGTYEWEAEVIQVEYGWYYILVEAPDGVEAGSFIVEVYIRANSYGENYYGTTFYIIDCTATTTYLDIE